MIARTFTAVVHREEELYVAECPEIGTVSQGKTAEEAVGTLRGALRQAGITPEQFGDALG